jgi:deoxyribose-phosphate aldolase
MNERIEKIIEEVVSGLTVTTGKPGAEIQREPDRTPLFGTAAELSKESVAARIDHTILRPDATHGEIMRLCAEADRYRFAAVCVNPIWIKPCAERLVNTDIAVCSVIGFPLGANTTCLKVEETKRAVADGATEIDMVLNIGKFKSGDMLFAHEDILRVVEAAHPAHVKVIIEACLLTDEEKVAACVIAKQAGVSFVKTSTGFSRAGATVKDVTLMRRVVGKDTGVKAAGGIRDYRTAVAMINAGADRLGTSASVSIVS